LKHPHHKTYEGCRKEEQSAVLEQVMAEYFDNPPQIEFAPSGVSYELTGSLEALTG
jgi:hypothetical protein